MHNDCEVSGNMGKYKYEKFQIKAGQKTYLLSRHDGDNWEGPCVEHFAKQKATKIGYFSSDRNINMS